jgi:hypothetical protein
MRQSKGKESQSGTIISTLFGTNPNQTNNSSNPNNPAGSLFGTGSPYTAALLAAINRAGSGIGDDVNDTLPDVNDSVVRSGISIPVTARGGLGLLTFGAGPHGERSQFKASELLLVDGTNQQMAPHNGRAPISSLVARGIQEYGVPRTQGNEIITVVDPSKLTLQPYEIRILSVPLRDGSTVQPGVFEITNAVTGEVRTTGPVEVRRVAADPHQDQIRIEANFDGLRTQMFPELVDSVRQGQTFQITAVKKLSRDANVQLPIQRYVAGNGLEKLQTVIIKSSEDLRPVIGPGFDTELSGPTEEFILSDYSSLSTGKVCTHCDGKNAIVLDDNSHSFIDARITSRSNGDSKSPVQLAGGVVIADQTALTVTNSIMRSYENPALQLPPDSPPIRESSQTSLYFQGKNLQPSFGASVATIVARRTLLLSMLMTGCSPY